MNDLYKLLAEGLADSKPRSIWIKPTVELAQWNKDVTRTSIACSKWAAINGQDFNVVEFYDVCGYEYKR